MDRLPFFSRLSRLGVPSSAWDDLWGELALLLLESRVAAAEAGRWGLDRWSGYRWRDVARRDGRWYGMPKGGERRLLLAGDLVGAGEDGDQALVSLAGSPRAECGELAGKVRAAIADLPEVRDRELARLKLEGLSLSQIGRRMGVSEGRACQLWRTWRKAGSVKSQLRDRLRGRMPGHIPHGRTEP